MLNQCFKVEIHRGAVQIFVGLSFNLFIRAHAKTFAFVIEIFWINIFSSQQRKKNSYLDDRVANLMLIKADFHGIEEESGRFDSVVMCAELPW